MSDKSEKYNRRSIRLQSYDYTQPGPYFVTICIQDRKCAFGKIVNGEIHLNHVGQMIQSIWLTLPERFPGVKLDQYLIMPNHLHGIITLRETQFITPNDSYISKIPDRFKDDKYIKDYQGEKNPAPTLGEVIRTFKAATTYCIHTGGMPGFCWQHRYYEHIIRNDDDLNRVRQYIIDNPTRWTEDNLFHEDTLI